MFGDNGDVDVPLAEVATGGGGGGGGGRSITQVLQSMTSGDPHPGFSGIACRNDYTQMVVERQWQKEQADKKAEAKRMVRPRIEQDVE